MDEIRPGKKALPRQLDVTYRLARERGELEVAELVLRALEELARRDPQAKLLLDSLYLESAQQPAHRTRRGRPRTDD